MTVRSAKRVLLVSPAFHGYWRSVARALAHTGFEPVPFVYDDDRRLRAKLRRAASVEIPARFGRSGGATHLARRMTAEARRALAGARPDAVLAIRSDGFLDDLWDDIADRGLPSTLWLYDELARVPHPIERLTRFAEVATYSRGDHEKLTANGVQARHLPNAFDPDLQPRGRSTSSVVFVGARYPGRERTITSLAEAGVPVLAVGRDWSHHPLDRLRTGQLHRPDVPWLRDVDRSEAYALMQSAPACLNLHERQDGFTMRTFEACGLGSLQLVDRPDIGEVYEPGREVVPFASDDELAAHCRRAVDDPDWARRIGAAARARTLAEHTFVHRVAVLAEAWR